MEMLLIKQRIDNREIYNSPIEKWQMVMLDKRMSNFGGDLKEKVHTCETHSFLNSTNILTYIIQT